MARFAGIKFNLMRSIEMFQDLNHDDMDVMAPPSNRDYEKEAEVAFRLNKFLGQLIEDGLFDNCERREVSDQEDVEDEQSVFDEDYSSDNEISSYLGKDDDEEEDEEEEDAELGGEQFKNIDDAGEEKDDETIEHDCLKIFSKKLNGLNFNQFITSSSSSKSGIKWLQCENDENNYEEEEEDEEEVEEEEEALPIETA